jgi:hypothetical protein
MEMAKECPSARKQQREQVRLVLVGVDDVDERRGPWRSAG